MSLDFNGKPVCIGCYYVVRKVNKNRLCPRCQQYVNRKTIIVDIADDGNVDVYGCPPGYSIEIRDHCTG